jgi:hypothetical protein
MASMLLTQVCWEGLVMTEGALGRMTYTAGGEVTEALGSNSANDSEDGEGLHLEWWRGNGGDAARLGAGRMILRI